MKALARAWKESRQTSNGPDERGERGLTQTTLPKLGTFDPKATSLAQYMRKHNSVDGLVLLSLGKVSRISGYGRHRTLGTM